MLHQDLVTHCSNLCSEPHGSSYRHFMMMMTMIAFHTYIMFVSEPVEDMFSRWGQMR